MGDSSSNMSRPSICIAVASETKLSTATDDKSALSISDGRETFARDNPFAESQQSNLSQQSQHRRRPKTGHSSLRRSKEDSSSKESSDEPRSSYHGHLSTHSDRLKRSEEKMQRMVEEAFRNVEERLEARLGELMAHLHCSIEWKHGTSGSSSSHRFGQRSSKSTSSRTESSKSTSSRTEAKEYLDEGTAKLCSKPTGT